MWKSIRWRYSQWKLLYFLLWPLIQWLLRGILDEWVFNHITGYIEGRTGWLVDVLRWIDHNPTATIGIVMALMAAIIIVLAVRDARRKVTQLYGAEDIVRQMFSSALIEARAKASTIPLDAKWDSTMKEIAKDIVGIDATEYADKNMRDKKETAKIEERIREVTPTDEDTVPIFSLMASAMERNGYGIDVFDGQEARKKLKQKLDVLRRVPSKEVNDAVEKCLDYIRILSNIYIYHVARMRNTVGLGQETLAQMYKFVQDQENCLGDMSKCLTELRIAIDNFVGDRNDRKR